MTHHALTAVLKLLPRGLQSLCSRRCVTVTPGAGKSAQ